MPVTNIASLGGLNKLKALHNLKQREIFCPVTKMRVITTPLTVGDDLSLRTMITSPESYDREIATLIYRHTKFPDFPERPSFEKFIDVFSSFDRRIMLYGIYATTYDKIAEEEIKCSNCSNTFKDVIKSEEIINADVYQVWDKDEVFTNYFKEVSIDINPEQDNTINTLVFITGIPSIRDHFNILKLVRPDKMKYNFEKTGQILSKSEELALITKAIKVNSTVQGTSEVDIINDLDNINQAINDYITPDIVNDVVTKYNDEFNKYSPSFKKAYTCSNCGFDFDVPVNIEASLFRSFFGF